MSELFSATLRALTERDPWKKCELVAALSRAWQSESLAFDPDIQLPDISIAGHPDRPELVNPRDLLQRGLGSAGGRAALIHAITHIEFNAINLALDAVCRFRQMPAEFYTDWLNIASEESNHFNLLNDRLNKLDCNYGDFPAHNGLWDMAMRTAHDPLHRMALIPRVMEARGLDVTPGMIKRFRRVGDQETVEILEVILREEIGHVKAGSRWFNYLCEQRGLDTEKTYLDLVHAYMGNGLHCPMHLQTRLDAGFSESELENLARMCRQA
ncbi:MAG: ferritin-like domain-containing protein [Pseudomonadota bacterium]|nr:ferritin-like domain-containing protein [Pseudomonadota bacterium]